MKFESGLLKVLAFVLSIILVSQATLALPSEITGLFNQNREYTIPQEMKKEVRTTSKSSYKSMVKSLPEDYAERKNMTVKYASDVCQLPEFEKYEAGVESSDEAQALTRQLQNSIEITNNYLKTGLKSEDIAPVYSSTKKVAKYASAVDSYKTWRNRSCNVSENPSNKSMKKFYKSTSIIVFELGLIQTAASYKLSSKATRILNRKAGVARVRKYCGDECYSTALSLPHWGVRFSSEGFSDYVLDVTNNHDKEIPDQNVKEISKSIEKNLPEKKEIEDNVTGGATKASSVLKRILSAIFG